MKLTHEFVKNIPDNLENGKIYISMEYATAIHKCCCGCGNEIVTPLSPTDWKLTFDGETISLNPSIGNWSLKCKSHYWIQYGEVIMAPKWSQKQIKDNTKWDFQNKRNYFEKDLSTSINTKSVPKSIFKKLSRLLFSKVPNQKN
jgi:hypothetical protein